jgi:Uma2 family endonuclease
MLRADGMVRLFRGQVRIPDFCFIAWDSLPEGRLAKAPIADVTPDLVVEVLSRKKTKGEMVRKRNDYFDAGGKLFWEVDLRKRIVRVYTSPDAVKELTEADALTGGKILSGFRLSLRDLFGQLDRKK